MPLPLPSLDTRTYADLVAEGTALLPSRAPGWTDYNASDPGITLLELLAYLIEQDIYRVNRVPDRHRRKFLELVGFPPTPPRAARGALAFSVGPGVAATLPVIPAGLTLAATVGGASAVRFGTLRRMQLHDASIVAVQSFDGASYRDWTPVWTQGRAVPAFGEDPVGFGAEDPDARPALLVGLDGALTRGRIASLWVGVQGGREAIAERRALADEQAAWSALCMPPRPSVNCTGAVPATSLSSLGPASSSAAASGPCAGAEPWSTAWEYHDGNAWQALVASDQTLGLVLDGAVRVLAKTPMAEVRVGVVPEPRFWLRCRAAGGVPDEAPMLSAVAVNAVAIEQRFPVRQRFAIAPGTPSGGPAPTPGRLQRLDLAFDSTGTLTRAGVTSDSAAPTALVLAYSPSTGAEPGSLEATIVRAGSGTGAPEQALEVSDHPVTDDAARVWTLEPDGVHTWTQRPDFDVSLRADEVYVLDAQAGMLRFGDGARGRVPPAGAAILASYGVTSASAGNVPASATWSLDGADDDLNQALSGGNLPALVAALTPSPGLGVNRQPIACVDDPAGGADAEDVQGAGSRAAEAVAEHERLVEIARAPTATLDGLDQTVVRARRAPARAATLLDFERLALTVPGTRVRRARAWASFDPAKPGLTAPGVVAVVVVPGYPPARPEPSEHLLRSVERYLRRRKTLGMRVAVVGPTYVEVTVAATLQPQAHRDHASIMTAAQALLQRYLNPLTGGPSGRGWPFGRDVYRSELLALLDGIAGIDWVVSLGLTADGRGLGCGNVCVGRTELVVSGTHAIEVQP